MRNKLGQPLLNRDKILQKIDNSCLSEGIYKIKHNCWTFPFNLEKKSICTLCRANDCDHLTIWIGRRGDTASRFILQIPADMEMYTGEEKRCTRGTKFNIKEVHGRIEDLVHFARHYRGINVDTIRDEALPYILGVDECPGFNKLGQIYS